MKLNAESIELIKRWEGLRLTAYKDTGGVWTIGYGHTSDDEQKVYEGLTITEEKAHELLLHDLKEAEEAVQRLVTVPLSENQYGALVSFVYNVGELALASSTLLKRLNAGKYDDVPAQLRRWVYDNGKKVKGLVNRRNAEVGLWTRGEFVTSRDMQAAPPKKGKALLSPEGVATILSPLAGVLAVFTDAGEILQYSLAAVMLIAAGVGAYYIVKRINSQYD